jgi:hypothetical protein
VAACEQKMRRVVVMAMETLAEEYHDELKDVFATGQTIGL